MESEHWAAVIGSLRKTKPTLSPLLEQVAEWRQQAETLVLVLDSRYAADSLRNESAVILAACREIIPSVQKVDFQVQEKAAAVHHQNAANDPAEKVREIFHGEIVRQGGQK